MPSQPPDEKSKFFTGNFGAWPSLARPGMIQELISRVLLDPSPALLCSQLGQTDGERFQLLQAWSPTQNQAKVGLCFTR